MKNLLLAIIVLLVLSCTNNPTNKAIELVKSYQKEFDMQAFSSIKYSNIDSLFSNFEDDEDYQNTIKNLNQLQSDWKYQALDYYADIYDPTTKLNSQSLKDALMNTQNQIRNHLRHIDYLKSKFTPEFRGYILNQTYTYPTINGDSVMLRSFIINKDITHIVNIESNPISIGIYEKMIEMNRISTEDVATWRMIKQDSLYLDYLGINKNINLGLLEIDTMEFVK